MLTAASFFDLEGHRFAGLFEGTENVWEALPRLKGYIRDTIAPNVAGLRKGASLVGRTLVLHQGAVIDGGFTVEEGDVRKGGLVVTLDDGTVLAGASVIHAGAILAGDDIEIGRGVLVEPGAYVRGPTVLGDRTEVRQAAYVRGTVLAGEACVIGHATEVKASALLGGSVAGHFAYIGDSILGEVNLGAGTKLANLKVFGGSVTIRVDDMKLDTGLRKMGAVLGDGVETGCNSVTMPGTVLGRGVAVYPNVTVRGFHAGPSVIKTSVVKGAGRETRG